MLEDSKAFRADCGWVDIYGIYAAISSQTNIQMFIFSLNFDNFSTRVTLQKLRGVVDEEKIFSICPCFECFFRY